MTKQRKVRIDRVIILILVAILVGGTLGFGLYKLFDLFTNNKEVKVNPVETVDSLRLSLNDYDIYYDDTGDLGFNFIIADINFSSKENVSCNLGILQTSEKIYLNDVTKYLNKLSSAAYDLTKLGISYINVTGDTNNVNAKVFVPFSTDASNLSVYNSLNASNSINFDLTKDALAATTLKLNDTSNQIVVGNTTVYISRAYISSTMLHLGDRYVLPNTIKVYTYEISANESKDNVQIVDAILYVDGSDYENHCLNDEYNAVDCENALNKNLELGHNGGLFFEIISDEEELKNGTLLIKFSNSNDWIEISEN